MNVRLKNARVMTMEQGCRIFSDGEVEVRGSKIIYCGAMRSGFSPAYNCRELDLKGSLIMPGFKNAHTHSPMSFLRSFADDLPLDRWLHEKIFPIEAKLTSEDIYHLTKLSFLEYLTSGITACFDMYFEPAAIVRAAEDFGFRTVLCGIGDPVVQEECFLRFNEGNPLVSYILGFHAEYTTGEETLMQVAALAHKHKAPVYAHISETKAEVVGCLTRHRLTPVMYLDSLGMFDYGGGGFHCVYLTDEEMDVFARKGLFAVTNPASNLKLASGIAQLSRLDGKGVRIAIGTDGPASNNALDFFREMYLSTALQKVVTSDASAMPAEKVLEAATTGGAAAMGLTCCDVLAVGKAADLVVIDLNRPNMQPISNIAKNLVYSGSKENVRLTMINGEILYENGSFCLKNDTAAAIYRKAQDILERLGGAD